jgi:hypothetical protein
MAAQVYKTSGISPVRVSNAAIESFIAPYLANAAASAYGYVAGGHEFYCINFGTSVGNWTPVNGTTQLVYDLTENLWHERTYIGPWPFCFASIAGGGFTGSPDFIGDAKSGKVMNQSLLYFNDGDPVTAKITYTRNAPHVSKQNQWVKFRRFELDGDFGTAQPFLSYSNDGGRSFNPWNYALQQAADQGAPGTFRRFYAHQLGRSRDRVFQVTITDGSNPIRIANAYIDVVPGIER